LHHAVAIFEGIHERLRLADIRITACHEQIRVVEEVIRFAA